MVTVNYPFFSVVGVEIEYMLVDRSTYDIVSISDQLIKDIHGDIVNECSLGEVAISNEFVLHVLEMKTNGPKPIANTLDKSFAETIQFVNDKLKKHNAMLMPGAMHPWYQPGDDVKLWSYDNHEIYQAYHQIFQSKGHGFANIQSVHINLPFSNDDEFVKLHSAIRVLLPILPALAASSPFCEGEITGYADTRLHYYGQNQKKVPSISGDIIPEYVASIDDYHQRILQPMYQDIAHYEQAEILQEEWLNSRGCIARFDRNAIEIRLLDTQESPLVDCTLVSAVIACLQRLINKTDIFIQKPLANDALVALYRDTIKRDLQATHFDKKYCQQLGIEGRYPTTARDLWHTLIEQIASTLPHAQQRVLEYLLVNGTLSSRLMRYFNKTPSLAKVCQQLSLCCQENKMFSYDQD